MKIVSEYPLFSIVPEWLIESKVSDNGLRVYATLCRFADKIDGSCWPSINTIAKRCHKSPSSVKRAIKELKDIGAIEVKARYLEDHAGQTSNLYIIKFNPAYTKSDTTPHIKDEMGGSSNMEYELKSSNQSHIINTKTNKNEVYKALCDHLFQPKTKNEISGFNKVAKDLSEINATYDDVKNRIEIYRKKWANMTLTPFALSKNWTLLGEMFDQNKPQKMHDCKVNGHNWIDLDVIYYCQFCKSEKSK